VGQECTKKEFELAFGKKIKKSATKIQ